MIVRVPDSDKEAKCRGVRVGKKKPSRCECPSCILLANSLFSFHLSLSLPALPSLLERGGENHEDERS